MNGTPENLLVAAIQMNAGPDRERNHATALRLMTEAADSGARLVALPENFSYIGDHPVAKLANAEDPENSPSLDLIRSTAVKKNISIVGGSIPLRTADPAKVTNTTFVIDQSGIPIARYDKIHLFDANLGGAKSFRESEYVRPGALPVCVNIRGWEMGLSICYDLRFPEHYRILAAEGATVFLVPSAFTVETGRAHWEILLRARAIENLCYVVAPAQWGRHTAARESYGRTTVVSPWGEIIAELHDGEGIVLCELDQSLLSGARAKLPGIRTATFRGDRNIITQKRDDK
ncbi:MAG: carbon-nitrogen hydrolase family protein [Ignavibacteria bacterium]|nr:carbon-nitrogen hydrolase family protein [Ignavibacteria bacterium]